MSCPRTGDHGVAERHSATGLSFPVEPARQEGQKPGTPHPGGKGERRPLQMLGKNVDNDVTAATDHVQ